MGFIIVSEKQNEVNKISDYGDEKCRNLDKVLQYN